MNTNRPENSNGKNIVILILCLVIVGLFAFLYMTRSSDVNNLPNSNNNENTSSGEQVNDSNSSISDLGLDGKANAGELDEVELTMKDRIDDSEIIDINDYLQLIWVLLDKGDYENVILYGKKAETELLEQIEKLSQEDKNDEDNKSPDDRKNNDKKNTNKDSTKREIHEYMVEAYIYLGDYTKAKEYTSLYSKGFEYEKALLDYKMGNYDKVIELSNIKINSDEQDGFIYDIIAKAYINKGDKEKAIEMYEKLFKLSTDTKSDAVLSAYYGYVSSFRLIELYKESGKNSESKVYSKKFNDIKTAIEKGKIKDTETNTVLDKDTAYFILERQNDL